MAVPVKPTVVRKVSAPVAVSFEETLPCSVKACPVDPIVRALVGVMVLVLNVPTEAVALTVSAVPEAVKVVAPEIVLAEEPVCVYEVD